MTLDELLLEWSYRSDRGYPSVDSPSDILVLKGILRELNLPEREFDDLVDDLEDEPGGDDLSNPSTDGMEDSPVEKGKEKAGQKFQMGGSNVYLTQRQIKDNIENIKTPPMDGYTITKHDGTGRFRFKNKNWYPIKYNKDGKEIGLGDRVTADFVITEMQYSPWGEGAKEVIDPDLSFTKFIPPSEILPPVGTKGI